jgi:hypothetical protein
MKRFGVISMVPALIVIMHGGGGRDSRKLCVWKNEARLEGGLENHTAYFFAFFFGAAFFFMVLQAILLPPYESELP